MDIQTCDTCGLRQACKTGMGEHGFWCHGWQPAPALRVGTRVDVVDNLNDEGRAAMMADAAVYELAYCEIERLLREDPSSPSYNQAVHDLRVRFLTGDEAPERVRDMVRTLLQEVERQKLRVQKADERTRILRRHLRSEYDDLAGPDLPYDVAFPRTPTDEEVDAVIKERTPLSIAEAAYNAAHEHGGDEAASAAYTAVMTAFRALNVEATR